MGTSSHRRALGALFLVLAAVLAGIAWEASKADEWVIVVAAGVLAAWMAGLVVRSWSSR